MNEHEIVHHEETPRPRRFRPIAGHALASDCYVGAIVAQENGLTYIYSPDTIRKPSRAFCYAYASNPAR